MKNLKQVQKSNLSAQISKVEALVQQLEETTLNVPKEALEEVEIDIYSLDYIRSLATAELRKEALELRRIHLEENATIEVVKQNSENFFLKGSHQVGRNIYKNSLNWKETSSLEMFKQWQRIFEADGKCKALKNASFVRTFNTSLNEELENVKFNKENNLTILEEGCQTETLRYFHEINKVLTQVVLTKEDTSLRLRKMLNSFTDKQLLEGIKVSFRTLPVKEEANIKTVFGTYNMVLVEEESLELFRTYLVFKGANTSKTMKILSIEDKI